MMPFTALADGGKPPKGSSPRKTSSQPGEGGFLGLKIIVLVAGAVLMSLEIVGSRLLAPHFGNSVYVWGSLISVFLIALSLGYWVGGHLADRRPSAGMLAGLCIAVAALIFLIPWIGHPFCRYLLGAGLGEQSGPLAAASLLFLPPSFLLGMVSPFSVRLTATTVQSVGRTAGSLYALSTIGSILGTLCTTFVLIPFVGVSWILKCLGIVMAVLPLALAVGGRVNKGSTALLLVVGTLGLLIPSTPSFLLASNETLILDEETAYHHLSVVDVGAQKRFLQFDRFIESSIRLQAPYPPNSEYTNYFHLAFLLKPEIRRSVFIGAGGGIGPRTFALINPAMEIDVVDIDKRVLDIAEHLFFMPRIPTIHPVADDGRMFFRTSAAPYDCVVLDAFTVGGRIPFHLVTREYFETLRSHMTSDGVFVMNVSSAITGEKSGIYRSVLRTLEEVFPSVVAFASGIAHQPDRHLSRNVIFVATVRSRPITREALLESISGYPERSYVTRDMLRAMIANLVQGPVAGPAAEPFTDDLAPIETMSF